MKLSTSLPVEVMKMAFDSIAGHKFRSALTILGIVVGIITAVVVASILTGMRQSIVSIVEEYGTNNIYVFHLSMGGGVVDSRGRVYVANGGRDVRVYQPGHWNVVRTLSIAGSVGDFALSQRYHRLIVDDTTHGTIRIISTS